jgi:hypothetical protein
MVDAMISRVRLRDLACLGRGRLAARPARRPRGEASAPCRRAVADVANIADDPPARPRAASSRPEACDLMASTI